MVQLQGAFHPSLALFLGLSGLVVLWMGSQYVIAGRMTIGEFVAFNAYVVMLSWPMIAFGWVTNMLQRGMSAWQRMLIVFEVEPSIRDSAAARSRIGTRADSLRGEVEFRDLTFAYNGRNVLSNVSATVQPGQMLALVGPTGSGKSTLVELIPRLFDPPPGTVFVDGMDVRDMPLSQLRRAIGYVSQEPFLFSETVASNIRYNTPDVDMDQVIQAAKTVGAHDFIERLPKGYETVLEERGSNLSIGQRQLISFARAIVADTEILVLDEATASIDSYTELMIQKALAKLLQGRTGVMIAHRLATIRGADRIIVLQDGRIVEIGNHDELMEKKGLYFKLYSLNYSSFDDIPDELVRDALAGPAVT